MTKLEIIICSIGEAEIKTGRVPKVIRITNVEDFEEMEDELRRLLIKKYPTTIGNYQCLLKNGVTKDMTTF